MNHLVPLCDKWSLWSWACLRGTGFPARLVLDLASAPLAGAADRILDQESAVARAREQLVAECKAAGTRVDAADRSVQRALKRLWQHKLPEPIGDAAAEAARLQLAEATAQLETLARELTTEHTRAHRVISDTLRRIGRDDRFRQALLWQNRSAVRAGLDALLRQPADATDSKTRSKERLLASYVQRYCVKNDTIGFFGPCGWARLVHEPAPIAQRPGPGLLASRTVYFEYWAIDALATKLSADPELRPFLAPRLLPRFRLEGTTLHYPIGKRLELSAEQAAVAARCDGLRSARAIAAELSADATLELPDEASVLAVLDELAETPVIVWALEIPTATAHPEHHLAGLLAAIPAPELRARAGAALAELEHARAAVAASTDGTTLDQALDTFETAFTRVTDAESHRAHGQTYAGRTPLFEECRRDVALAIGEPVLARLGPTLAMLLHSARWFTHEIATRYRRELTAIYRRLRDEATAAGHPATEPLDFARFWKEVPALFPGGAAPGSIVFAVRGELRARWASLLAIQPGERAVQRSADALADAARQAFAAPGPGWPAARHHSPDVMIAAAGEDALARGDYRLVLGEMHAGFNTLAGPFVKLHPHPEELVAARDADLAHVGIAPVWSKAITNADYYSPSARDLDLENGDTRSARPRDHVIAVGELVVADEGGQVEVRTRDGARRFDIITFMEHHLIAESFAAFSPIEPAPWSPRVTIDDVVIARETWRVTPADVPWPAIEDPAARYLAARRWARALGMPRWVFVKTPEEVKPVYVDFDSAIYVDMLAKQLRGASAATLSEMLPSVADTWLADAAGDRYTAELRIVAVDPAAWQPEPAPQLR